MCVLRDGEGAGVNRADLLYAALKDGKPMSRREIFEHAGQFFCTNNAACELRQRGFDVPHTRDGRLDVYQLVDGSLTEREAYGPTYTREEMSLRGARESSRSVSDSLIPSGLEPWPPDLGSDSAHPSSPDSSCAVPSPPHPPHGTAQLSLLVAA